MKNIDKNSDILNNPVTKNVLGLLSAALNDKRETFNIDISLWPDIKKELELHAVLPLISKVKMNPTLPDEEKVYLAKRVAMNIRNFNELMKAQSDILYIFKNNNIHAAVLKGAAAGQYYLEPELRTYGDIDIIVSPDDFKKAFELLCDAGYKNILSDIRLTEFMTQNGSELELHFHFSRGLNKKQNDLFDGYLYDSFTNIKEIMINKYIVPVFPTVENGLILLGHIYQHIGSGLGLRQIIDWMLFVRNNLTVELWNNEFQNKAESIGLDYLAKTVTKMCQKYLGLDSNISWCKDVDDKLVDDLMIYILNNGNFGRKKVVISSSIDSIKSASAIHGLKSPIVAFKFLTNAGKYHMEKDGLKPNKLYAWLYQIRHLFLKFINSKDKRGIFNGIKSGTKDNNLIKRLRTNRL